MAICPSAGLLSLRQNLASATAQTGVRSSRHEQGGSDREIPTLGAFREQYAQAIHGQLGIWNMVQLIALCWFLNNLIVWMKRKATKNRDAKSRTSVSTKETAKGRATALTKARPSLIGRFTHLLRPSACPNSSLYKPLDLVLSLTISYLPRCRTERPWSTEEALELPLVYNILWHLSSHTRF